MRVLVLALALTAAVPAWAQSSGPFPDTIRSANLTQAQADELNRRLGTLRGALIAELEAMR
jgi:hypothetical protein